MTIGEAILAARNYRGLSQHQLARKSGISRGSIAHWETGLHAPSCAMLQRLAVALRCAFVVSSGGWCWAVYGVDMGSGP